VEKLQLSYTVDSNTNIASDLENIVTVLQMINISLTYDTTHPTYIPRSTTKYFHTKTCTWICIATLLIIAKKKNRNPNVHQLL
jgi:hypothetical protein